MTSRPFRSLFPLMSVVSLGCAPSSPAMTKASAQPPETPRSEPERPAQQLKEAKEAIAATATVPGQAASPYSCGPQQCRDFGSVAAALEFLLSEKKPLVLGLGEMHGQKSIQAQSTVVRFRREFLPVLAPHSSALIVELLAPPSGCKKETEKTGAVAAEVTTGQAENNQNEYLELGKASRELGLVPDILRASCAEMKAISDAGEMGVLVLMETVGKKTGESLLAYRAKASEAKALVLAYGGMLHNDLTPGEERATWSYGPRLSEATQRRYLELDLVAPEQLDSPERFARFDFAAALEAVTTSPRKTVTLIERSPMAFTLVFPGERPIPPAGSRP